MFVCLVPPFNVQSSVADEKNENESGRNVVDQSKAPGYRVMTKSPNVAEDTSGASEIYLTLLNTGFLFIF